MEVYSIQDATDYAVRGLIEHGEPEARLSLRRSADMTSAIDEIRDRAALFKAIGLFRVHGEDEGWIGVERATFFSPSHLRHATMAQKAGALFFPSRLWLPRTHKVKNAFAEAMRTSAERENLTSGSSEVASLCDWRPNRLGVNWMDGTPAEPAVIPEHVDTKDELGAIVILEVFGESMRESSGGDNVTILFGQDICDAFGVPQAVHSAVAPHLRLSVTLAELKPSR
jgi:hypothetical protein